MAQQAWDLILGRENQQAEKQLLDPDTIRRPSFLNNDRHKHLDRQFRNNLPQQA